MKRLLTSAVMFLCSLLAFAQFGGSGLGTGNDPYRYVGGLVGYNESSTTLKTSAAINTYVMATEEDVNRLVGYNAGNIAAVGSHSLCVLGIQTKD